MIPEAIQKFIESFSKLPSLGPRAATRLAFYLIKLDSESFKNLESSLGNLKKISRCEHCFFLKDLENKLCAICTDPKRNPNIVAIVEKETDLLSIEKTGNFNGKYLILGEVSERGLLESAQKLKLAHLKNRIRKEFNGKIEEIIIAVNPTTIGDFTTNAIREELKNLAEKITRLGRGIPTGGEIEFSDEETLSQALKRRI